MLTVNINRIRSGAEPRLRQFLAEMNERRDEVLGTFEAQGVSELKAFIVAGNDGPLFVLVAEVEDLARGREVFRASAAPIDDEFKRVMTESLEGHVDDTPVYECAVAPRAAG